MRPPTEGEAKALGSKTLISLVYPRQNDLLVNQLAEQVEEGVVAWFILRTYSELFTQNATVLSLDSLLRTLSRGQSFDVLSSQVGPAL